MASSDFRKTFWLLFGHSDKGLASAHNVTGLSYYTCFRSSQGCDANASKYLRICWPLTTAAQFGTLFLLNYIPSKCNILAQGFFLPHKKHSYTVPRAPFFSSSQPPAWKFLSPILSYLFRPTLP